MNKPVNIYKKAISHSALYGAADILRRIVGFIMLPIYTRYLTPEDYGVVQLFTVVITFMEILLGMRLAQAIFRYYALAREEVEKKQVISTAFFLTLAFCILAYILLYFNAGTATNIALGSQQYVSLMQKFAIILITQAIVEYGLIHIRIHQRPVLFFIVSIVTLFLQLGLNLYLIVYLHLTVEGVIYSSIISSVIVAVFAVAYILYYAGVSVSFELAKKLFLFSYPLWIAAVANFYITSADKYFVRIFSGLTDVGLYALSAKFGALIFIFVWTPFDSMWQSMRYDILQMPEPKVAYKRMFMLLMLALSVVGLGVSLFSDIVLRLMSAKSYWSASLAVPFLVVATIAKALTLFCNLGIFLKEKTWVVATGTYLNAIVITIAFFILIRYFGFTGAAIGAMIGAILNLVWVEVKSRKLYDMQLPWKRGLLMMFTATVCYVASLALPDSLLEAIAGKFAILIGFFLLVFLLPILDTDERTKILLYAKSGFFRVYSKLKRQES